MALWYSKSGTDAAIKAAVMALSVRAVTSSDSVKLVDDNNIIRVTSNAAAAAPAVTTGRIYYNVFASATTAVVTSPGGAFPAGYLLVATLGVQTVPGNITPPSGWAAIPNTATASGDYAQGGMYYKITGASEPTTYTWTSSTAIQWAIEMLPLTGYNATTPFNTSGETNGNSYFTAIPTPSLTPTSDNCLHIIAGYQNANGGGGTITVPTGYTMDGATRQTYTYNVNVAYSTTAPAKNTATGIVNITLPSNQANAGAGVMVNPASGSTTAQTITVPKTATLDLSNTTLGHVFSTEIVNYGTNPVNIVGEDGTVIIRANAKYAVPFQIDSQYGAVTLTRMPEANTWLLSGELVASA